MTDDHADGGHTAVPAGWLRYDDAREFRRLAAGYARTMSTQRGSGPDQDPDADPEMVESSSGTQPDQAEGADDRSETSG